jgi:hypothetical protein
LGEGDVQRVRFRLNGERILDPNEFAASLLVPLALTLMQFLRARMGLAKICWLVPLAVLLSGFSVSGSRGAAVATAAMVVYLFWRSPYRLQLLAVMAAAIIRIAASPIGQRFMSPTLHTASGRAGIWKVAFASLHQYWLLGAGIGNFDAAYRQYFLQVFHPDMLRWDRAAHSIVIGSAVELGIVGLVLVLALFYMEFRAVPPGRDAADRDLCDAMRAGVLGLFVCGLSLSLMALKCTWLAFTLVALMRSAILPARNQRRQPLKM